MTVRGRHAVRPAPLRVTARGARVGTASALLAMGLLVASLVFAHQRNGLAMGLCEGAAFLACLVLVVLTPTRPGQHARR